MDFWCYTWQSCPWADPQSSLTNWILIKKYSQERSGLGLGFRLLIGIGIHSIPTSTRKIKVHLTRAPKKCTIIFMFILLQVTLIVNHPSFAVSCIHIFTVALCLFQTLGVDLQPKKCHLPNTQDLVEMLVYDCGGLELYVDCLSQFVSYKCQ